MARQYLKVAYRADRNSQEEFNVIVNGEEYEAWKKGDKTIPLTDVVDSFDILVTPQGNQGLMGRASKQQLDNAFGTHKDVDVVTEILEKGALLSGGTSDFFSLLFSSFLSCRQGRADRRYATTSVPSPPSSADASFQSDSQLA